MNFKKLPIIFLVFLTLILSIGVISAADDNVAVLETPSSNLNTEIVAADANVVPQSDVVNTDVKQTGEVTSKPKIKTHVEADQIAVTYKKNKYFKLKIEDGNDHDQSIKHVKLKIKVGTGSKAKTYSVKTNSYGFAKISTKNLKVGVHKVKISSDDDAYEISKTSKIFVGKQYTKTIKSTSKNVVLKNKDVMRLKVTPDEDEKEAKVVLKKAKYTKILKAKFYLKNKNTGKVVVKTENVGFDDGKWEMPDKDFSYRYCLVKVKVYYISTK